jgi:hypothetical protein
LGLGDGVNQNFRMPSFTPSIIPTTRHSRESGNPVVKKYAQRDNIFVLSASQIYFFAGFPLSRE